MVRMKYVRLPKRAERKKLGGCNAENEEDRRCKDCLKRDLRKARGRRKEQWQ